MGAVLGRNMGMMSLKTKACHISIERGKVKQSGVSSQILMIRDTKNVVYF